MGPAVHAHPPANSLAPPGSYWLLAPLVGMGNTYCPLLTGQSELTRKYQLIQWIKSVESSPGAAPCPSSQRGTKNLPSAPARPRLRVTSRIRAKPLQQPFSLIHFLCCFPHQVPSHGVCCIEFKCNQVWARQISVDPIVSPL